MIIQRSYVQKFKSLRLFFFFFLEFEAQVQLAERYRLFKSLSSTGKKICCQSLFSSEELKGTPRLEVFWLVIPISDGSGEEAFSSVVSTAGDGVELVAVSTPRSTCCRL